MATVINNPSNSDSGNGMGFLLGIIVLVVVGVVFFIYVLPLIQKGANQGVQINVPKDVNVNVNETP